MATIVFPSDPLSPRKVDAEFQREAAIVEELGGQTVLVDHTELENGVFHGRNILTKAKADEYANADTEAEQESLREAFPVNAVFGMNAFYRGWMLTEEGYSLMHRELAARTVRMISAPEDYMAGYWFSGWYAHFRDATPASAFWSVPDFEASIASNVFNDNVRSVLGDGAYIVKDQVKSRKSEWETACFAPDADRLPAVAREFIRLQGEYIAGGLVIRAFEEFDKDIGETRVWWVDNEPVLQSPHPDTPDSFTPVDVSFIQGAVNAFNRPFITTDLARRNDGTWRVMEVSDGQVSGTPRGFDTTALFKALLDA